MSNHLLIVDSSRVFRSSLRAMLTSVPGVQDIRDAMSLSEALKSARQDPPALVILDLALPDGLGTLLIEPLKKLSPVPQIAVLTLLSWPAHRALCFKLGADWFFDKAEDVDELLEVVRGIPQLLKR